MKFSSAILSVVAVVLAGLVALSLISPPGKVRVGIYISIGVLAFLFGLRVNHSSCDPSAMGNRPSPALGWP
ncbi:hypothetical protein [Paracidovorax oryzae]|uniref:hypothetical protein n=1 Tax=Paracidovorax oryzae TaxID=862720 RepID=UPI0012FEB2FC|nr:hypothetical protein [Paracidovorax oryzae]